MKRAGLLFLIAFLRFSSLSAQILWETDFETAKKDSFQNGQKGTY